MMTPTRVRRRGAAATLVGLLLVLGACSADRGDSSSDPTSTSSRASADEPSRSAEPTDEAGDTDAEVDAGTETASASEGVSCERVDDATAQDIADGSIDPIDPVPGRSVAYRPDGMNGTYLVVMVFTGPGRPEPEMGVWAVKRSIEPDDHGPIQSIDRIARYVTSWPVARWIVEDDFRVSEARACTLV